MQKAARAADDGDAELVALLARYQCPLSFAAVRTRLLGAIASPASTVSPVATIAGMWGGTLPTFATAAAGESFMQALIGLWNRLTPYQHRGEAFRLSPIKAKATRDGLRDLAGTRRDEVDGFLIGLVGGDPMLKLPERARQALDILTELRGLLSSVHAVAGDPNKPMPKHEVTAVLRQLRSLSKIAETEIHVAVLACAAARRQTLLAADKRPLH